MAKVISFPTPAALDLNAGGSSTTQFHLEIDDESTPSNDGNFSRIYEFALNEDLWNTVGDSSNTGDSRKCDYDDDLDKFLCSTTTVSDNSLLALLEVSSEENEIKNETASITSNYESPSVSGGSVNQSLRNTPSLSSLAENHFKFVGNGKHENDSLIDIDDLADLLTSTCIGDRKTSQSEKLKSFSNEKAPISSTCVDCDTSLTDLLSIADEELNAVNSGSVGKDSCLGEELDDLLGACKTSTISAVSLASLAETHFVNSQSGKSLKGIDINFESVLSDYSSESNCKTSECVDDLLLSDQKFGIAGFDDGSSLLDILKAVNADDETNISNYINDSNDCVKQESSVGIIPSEVEPDDEQAPDIDLNSCVKNQYSVYSSDVHLPIVSSVKKGNCDEINYILLKTNTSLGYVSDPKITCYNNTTMLKKEILERQKETKVNLNQSLFGQVLSCKSKPDKLRAEKVSQIRSEILEQFCMPVRVNPYPQKREIIRKIVDFSNECVLPSVTGRYVFSVTSCGLQ